MKCETTLGGVCIAKINDGTVLVTLGPAIKHNTWGSEASGDNVNAMMARPCEEDRQTKKQLRSHFISY
jgi:hypothetical protein